MGQKAIFNLLEIVLRLLIIGYQLFRSVLLGFHGNKS